MSALDTALASLDLLASYRLNEADASGGAVSYKSGVANGSYVGTPTFGVAGAYTHAEMLAETAVTFGATGCVDCGQIPAVIDAIDSADGLSVVGIAKPALVGGEFDRFCASYNSSFANGFDIIFNRDRNGAGSNAAAMTVVMKGATGDSFVREFTLPDLLHHSGIWRLYYWHFKAPSTILMGVDKFDIAHSFQTATTAAGDFVGSSSGKVVIGGYSQFNTVTADWQGSMGRVAFVRGQIPLATRLDLLSKAYLSVNGARKVTAYYNFRDLSTLYQDAARTTPATLTHRQTIQGVTDLSGRGGHLSKSVSARAPKLQYRGGRLLGLSFSNSEESSSITRRQGLDRAAGSPVRPTTYGCIAVVRPLVAGGAVASHSAGSSPVGLGVSGDRVCLIRNTGVLSPDTPEIPSVKHLPGRPSVIAASVGTDGSAWEASRKRFFCDGNFSNLASTTESGLWYEVQASGGIVGGTASATLGTYGDGFTGIVEAIIESDGPFTDDEVESVYAAFLADHGLDELPPFHGFILGDSISSNDDDNEFRALETWQIQALDDFPQLAQGSFINVSVGGMELDDASEPSCYARLGASGQTKWAHEVATGGITFALVTAGYNDVARDNDLATMTADLDRLLGRATAFGSTASIVLKLMNNATGEPAFAAYNAYLDSEAGVSYDYVVTAPNLTYDDGIHPVTTGGHDLLAAAIVDQGLRPLLQDIIVVGPGPGEVASATRAIILGII